jgi:O-antigen/teichoic acid export membrane protein
VAGRDTAIKAMALLGNVVFARLFTPAEFGTVAFGLTVLTFVQVLSDGGLGVGLIRREQPPSTDELGTVMGYQLLVTVLLGVVIAGAALPFGLSGAVTATMMLGLPFLAFRTPTTIVLERDLNYRPLVTVELTEQLAFYGMAVGLVLAGVGVWSLVAAAMLRSVVGTAAMLYVSPVRRLTPAYSWPKIKPLLGFAVRFQAVQLVMALRLQALNVGVAVVGGLAMLGVWTLAWRLVQVPFLLFGALWRVSYPAAARLIAAGESAPAMIERGLGLAAVGTGAILVPIAGCLSPLVPLIFGAEWAGVAEILVLIFAALLVSGPISVATAGYLYAVGDSVTVLAATVIASLVWLAVTIPLLAPLGSVALGFGGMFSALVESVILSRATRRRTGVAFLPPIAFPWVAATIAGAAGWYVSRHVGHGIVAAVAGAAVATTLYAVPIAMMRREALRTIVRLARGVTGSAPAVSDGSSAASTGSTEA